MGANKHSEKWTLEDEEAWIDSVISSHGKINRTCKGVIDSRKVLEMWLNNYKTRKWDFKGASMLKTKVILALDELKPVAAG